MTIPNPSKKGRPILGRFFILLGLVTVFILGGWLSLGLCPLQPGPANSEAVEIPYGMGITRIASLLYHRDLLRNPLVFRIWAKITGYEDEVKAGTYALAPSMSVPRILSMLTDGQELRIKVTIPEGSTLREIADILDRQGVCTRETFLAHATDPVLIADVAPDAGASLEGYLFPDTYYLTNTAGAEGAIRIMAGRFREVLTPEMRARAKELGRTLHEVVIIASLVEKEAKSPEDRPLVASVFYNRLRLGMALQSCATVQYALGGHKDRLLYEDLQYPSPYNTYLNRGLPPGPIGNPGLASIQAALYPHQGGYLYFVAKPDGTHVFSRTYQDHLRAQREIKQGIR